MYLSTSLVHRWEGLMDGEHKPKGITRRTFLTASATALSSLALAACGQSDGGAQSGGTAGGQASAAATGAAGGEASAALKGAALKWSTWGTPGEIERFKQFTDEWNNRTGAKAELIPLPTDYEGKLLTQLSGGTGPDIFYSGDSTLSKLVASNLIVDLTERVSGPTSKSKPEEFYEGTWGPAKTADGKIYGMPVDCNPLVFWYNKKILQEAGVTTLPADLYKESKWTWDALTAMLEQVVATGKRGLIFENWWGPNWAWVTTNGGKVFDGNTFVAADDAKAKEALQFVLDNLSAKTFTYSGSLPKGQGLDAMFLSQQTAFIAAGRWYLPTFKKAASIEADIVPYPTNTGKKIEPAPLGAAYLVQNVKAANQDAAFAFLTDFVSRDGQIFRLKGGGNALPSIKGADEVVSEDNLPPNWQAFIDAREVGYAIWSGLANYPGLTDEINRTLDEVWLNGGEVDATLQKIAGIVKQKQGAS
ncbi:MAG TPA: hypothetical protein VFZ66_18545 [Herpetosiphonaceae bacterium]